MPSETFYRLPEEKRLRLTDAIKSELKRVPFSKISINRIVREAEIPRGSYYQYFSDSADLLSYVLQDFGESAISIAQDIWHKTDGCCRTVFDALFDHALAYGLSEEYKDIFFNLFSELRISDMFSLFTECRHIVFLQEILSKMTEPRQMRFEIMGAVFKDALALCFTHPEDIPAISCDFRKKLILLDAM